MKENVASGCKVESEHCWQLVMQTQIQQGTHPKAEDLEIKRVGYTEEDCLTLGLIKAGKEDVIL